MLGFEGNAGARAVSPPALAGDAAGERVAGVELDAGLGGEHLEHAAAGGIAQPRGELRPLAYAVEREGVVVSPGDAELLVARIDALAQRGRRGEVERRAADLAALARGDQRGVDGE